MTDQKPTQLQTISAYWCHYNSGELEDRYDWVLDALSEQIQALSDDAYFLIVSLAKSAPSERCESFVAAGPLEDYVNEIVTKRRAGLAKRIIETRGLRELLPQAWGQSSKLEDLASGAADNATPPAQPDSPLKMFDIKEIMGFWSSACVPSFVEDYQGDFNAVIDKLSSSSPDKREAMEDELKASAPDDKAKEYLDIHIFSRYRH